MSGLQVFYWRDERIDDIWAWARARGEQMVRYKRIREGLSPVTLKMVHEESIETAPASFFDNSIAARFSGGLWEWTEEIERVPA